MDEILREKGLKLMVKNLEQSVDSEVVASVFGTFGRIQKAFVVRDKVTRRSRGFAFVLFAQIADGISAMVQMNGTLLRGKPLHISIPFPFTTEKNVNERLFDTIPVDIANAMRIDSLAVYSTTPLSFADHMTQLVSHFASSDASIVDGTACVGGNTISFAKEFRKVIAVEFDLERHEMLQWNVEKAQLECKVDTFQCDFVKFIENHMFQHQTSLFLDPPWGGPDYKQFTNLQLSLGSMEIPALCLYAAKKSKITLIALKLPNNYDFSSLTTPKMQSTFANTVLITYCGYQSLSLVLLESQMSCDTFIDKIHCFPWKVKRSCYIQHYTSEGWVRLIPRSLNLEV